MPQFSFRLDDLNIIAPGQLRDQGLTSQAMTGKLALKIAPGNPRIGEDLREWNDELRAALDEPGGREYFMALVTYIMGVGVTPGDEIGSLSESLGPTAKEAYMTTMDMIEAREARRLLIRVLTTKFGALPEDRSKQVNEASGGQLETWVIRASTANTLDEVFD